MDLVGILPTGDDHGLLGDLALDDPVRTKDRVRVTKRDEHVVPARVRGLRNVRRGRIGVGVGVGMEDPHYLEPAALGVEVGVEMIAGLDRIDLCRRRRVSRRVALLDVSCLGTSS